MRMAIVALLIVLAASAAAMAQQAGDFGAGVIIGSPIGVTGKAWLSKVQAVDFGIGAADGTVLYGDYQWHAWDLFPKPSQGKFGGYVGVGPQLEFENRDSDVGIRTIVGLDYWVENHPVEIFIEGGPVFQIAPDAEVNADIGLGARFYFRAATAAASSAPAQK